jgi:hypothetical protein
VIEVGPGTGNLTRHLLATKAQVLAVEKDDTLIVRLRDELKQVGSPCLHVQTRPEPDWLGVGLGRADRAGRADTQADSTSSRSSSRQEDIAHTGNY